MGDSRVWRQGGAKTNDDSEEAPWPGKQSRAAQKKGVAAWPGKQGLTVGMEGGESPDVVEETVAAGGGSPLDPSIRQRVEPHVGADLGGVRVHGDRKAEHANAAIGARAFTHGSDVFLGAGESGTDVGLMAHELTHVVQQGSAGKQGPQALAVGAADHPAEREADAVAGRVVAGDPAGGAMIVDANVAARAGQLSRDAFLAQLRPLVVAGAEAEMGAGATAGCPYIEQWFAHFATETAAHVERVAQRYSGMARATSASDYFQPIVDRLRAGVRRWNRGEDVNGDLAAAGMTGMTIPPRPQGVVGAVGSAIGSAASSLGSALGIQRKPVADVVDRLGPGQQLDPTTAARMSSATGQDVSNVRVHTDGIAQRLASSMDAAAFTVGNNIAFGANTFNPGTPRGDALLAHELAHVGQQKRGAVDQAGEAGSERGEQDVAKAAVATESPAHEADAEQAGAGIVRRLYGGAKSVARKLGDSFEPALTSDVQLQRCGQTQFEQMPEPPQQTEPARLPMPVTLAFAGDRFDVSFEGSGGEFTFVIHYTGPNRTNWADNTMRLTTRMQDEQFTGVAPVPYHAEVSSITEQGLTVDLLGDHTRLAVLTDRVAPGFALESREHRFEASITSGLSLPQSMRVEWGGDSVAHATTPNATTDPAILSSTVQMGGFALDLHAQRFGTTNQVQFRAGTPVGQDSDELISFDHLEHVSLTVLVNNGRDLHIDLDGDRRADVRIVHTIEDTSMGRRHHFRSFTSDGILLTDHNFLSSDRGPIPADQDEATHRPNTSLQWPVGRPPVQGDVPGELPVATARPGGITELRIDTDGDRSKETLMRFHTEAFSTANPSLVTRVRIELVDIASSAVASTTVDLGERNAGWFAPEVREVADGFQPMQILLVSEFNGGHDVMLQLPPPVERGDRRIQAINVLGQTLSLDLPADHSAHAALVQARPDGAVNPSGAIGGVHFIDLQLGEQRDPFRFTAEQTGAVARFSVAGLDAGSPFTGAGITLTPGTAVTSLSLIAGDPRQIALDIDGDGRADILINDRFSQPTRAAMSPNPAEPVSISRQHIISIHGPRITGVSEQPFFIAAGHWYQRYGFGPSTEDREAAGATGAVGELSRQRAEGDVGALISRFEQAIAVQRFQAIQRGVISQALYDEWNALFMALTTLRPAVLPTPPQAPTTPPPAAQAAAAEHAASFGRMLMAATASNDVHTDARTNDPIGSSTNRTRTHRYTGEVDDVEGASDGLEGHVVRQAGAPFEIAGEIRSGNWTGAFAHYTTMRDGLDQWIADEMGRRFGPQAQGAQWQLNLVNQLRTTQTAHADAKRVQAVFVADNSYSNHDNYNTYHQMPLYLLVWREGTRWHLKDLTNPSQPYLHDAGDGDASGPGPELFADLDYAREFPKGVIRYDVPSGISGRVVTTERKTWVDYAGEAAMILGAVALAATGAGAVAEAVGATVATVECFSTLAAAATITSGAAGALSAGGDILERARHGDLNATSLVVDIAQAAANVFTMGAASAKILVGAARTASLEGQAFRGLAARASLVADHVYIPLTQAAAAADVVSVMAMMPDVLAQLHDALANTQGSPGDRQRTIALLLGNLFAMGAITAMSVHGAFAEMRAGRTNIVIDFVDNVPVAHAAGVSIGGREIHVASDAAHADANAATRWNAHGLEEAAHEGNPGATAMTSNEETMRWYRAWMEQDSKVEFAADGRARVRQFRIGTEPMPDNVRADLQRYLDNPQNALSLYERSFINTDRIRALESQIPGLDLNPASESWRTNRPRIIAALGGDEAATNQVRRYEAAMRGAAGINPAQYAAEQTALTAIVPQTELDRIKALYSSYDVYVTGSAPRPARAGAPVRDVPDLDIFVVVPANTSPDVMAAMEQRARGYRVRTDPDFNTQHNHPADHTIGLDAKVMTPEQFMGFATTVVPAAAGQTARTPATYHSITATSGAAAGSREASAQIATRVMANDAAAERLITALGDNHARIATITTALGDGETQRIVHVLGDERFARYAAAADGPTIKALVDAVPEARLHLLENHLTPQQIADVWRGGGAAGIHLAETLPPADLARVMSSLGGERFGRYAGVAGMDGASLGRMTTAVPDATLRNVERRMTAEQVVGVFRAGGADAVEAVNGAITLEANGRISGLNDWITFTAGKGPVDLRRSLGELAEARRLVAENPRSVINVGGDQHAPPRPNGTPGQTFDLTVQSPTGTVERSVEVTTVDNPVSQRSDVTDGVRHAADKVASRVVDGNPIPGAHDATIRMQLDVGDRRIGGGRTRRIAPNGDYQIIDGDGTFRPRRDNQGNLFDDIATNLGAIPTNVNLDRVTLVDFNGGVLATYNRGSAGWVRVP